VRRLIHMLNVVQKQVYIRENLFKQPRGGKACSIETDMQSAVFQPFRQIADKLKLRGRLPAGNGYSAAVLKEAAILIDAVVYFVDRSIPTGGV